MKLENGKTYITRSGEIIKIRDNPDRIIYSDYPFESVDYVRRKYTTKGFCFSPKLWCKNDIVSEYQEPKQENMMKLEVGKTYKNKEGNPVKILYIADPSEGISTPIFGVLKSLGDKPIGITFFDGGKYFSTGADSGWNLTYEEVTEPALGELFDEPVKEGEKLQETKEIRASKLEVGKTYLTRKGEKVKILSQDDEPDYPYNGIIFGSGSQIIHYTPDGRVWADKEHGRDIMSEYTEPKQENMMNQEQQKPLFEVGKTYKNKRKEQIKILADDPFSSESYPLVGRNLGDKSLISFTLDGLYQYGRASDEDLIPPKPALPIVIGGFYLDDKGILRVLVKGILNKQYLFASAVNGENHWGSINISQFPRFELEYIHLVKLLTYEEAQKLIK